MSALAADELIAALVTLIVVVDPIGLAPIFVSVTDGLPEPARRQVAVRACLIGAGVLIGFALVGNWVLSNLGISLPAFRIAGGLLLFTIAFEMVFEFRSERQAKTAERAVEEHVRHIAAFPLGMPLIAGPGAITATLLVAANAAGNPLRLAALIAIIGLVILATLAVFFVAARVARLLGTTGNAVLSRLFGVILAALAVQFIIDGVRAVMTG
jgi:multiple antibiotic resistance protein